jgi:hypothetical protein
MGEKKMKCRFSLILGKKGRAKSALPFVGY